MTDPLSLNAILGAGQSNAAAPRTTGEASKRLGQDDFLSLMIAQLQNQDPMKPMENGEFLGQMAQFGTVSGIQDLQKSFTDMAANLQSNQALMGSSLVGRTVEVPSEFGVLVPGSALRGAATLDGAASDVTLEVVDASGALVRRLSLGAQDGGEVPYAWDGIRDDGTTAAPGLYAIRALARIGNENVGLDTRVQARVDSVTLGGQNGMELNLAGMWPVAFKDVTKIL